MKNTRIHYFLLLALALTVGLLTVAPAHAAIAFVQVNAASGSSTSTESVAFTSNTTAGDLILVGSDFSSGSISSVTDTQGNTFTQVGSTLDNPNGHYAVLFYAPDIKGGADTVTVKISASASFLQVYLTEYSGVATSSPLDVQAGAVGTGSTVSSGSATTTVADDLIFGYMDSGGTGSKGSGFTLRSGFSGNVIEDEIAGAAGSYAATGTSTSDWTMQMAAFKPSSGTTVATPTFSPAAGTYTTAQSVTISDGTSGATIYYTTNDTTPTTNSSVYSSAIDVSATETLEALATHSGDTNSSVGTAAYTISSEATVATPTFSPAAGTYTTAQSVSISDGTSGATIYYTTNDTTPTTSSSVYSSAIDVSATETLEALATHSGDTNSSVGTAAYTISSEATVATPTFSPAAGTYTTAQSVSISDGTSGATIYYTTNDTTPTTSSSVYSSAISVTASETLEALATHSGDINSAVGTAAYTISSGSTCDITASNGVCPSSGLYYDTSLSPTTWGQITQNDVWGSGSVTGSWSQEIYTTSPGDWYVVANFPSGGGGEIFTYPSACIQYYEDGEENGPNPTLDSFTEIVGAFDLTVPSSSTGVVSDMGYDMWFNDWDSEVMIQHDIINTDVCTDWTTVIKTDVEFGGSNGVPDAYWNLCQNGTFGSSNPELIWQYYATSGSSNFGVTNSSVDVYAMLKYLEGNSICKTSSGTTACLPSSSTLTQFGYGFEISTTDGVNQTFSVNSWTQTAVQ